MKRIYFLVPNVATTHRIVDELQSSGIAEKNIHLVANKSTNLEDLPEASTMQKRDFIPAMERGVAVGGATGLLCGLAAMALPVGMVIGGGALLGLTLAGAGFGAWISGMIGLDVEHPRVKEFEHAITEEGQLLMLVDVEKDREGEVKRRILGHYPDAEIEQTDSKTPLTP